MSVPNIIHFCYFGGRPISLVNYVAIKEAAKINSPDKIYFHYDTKPTGKWWMKAKKLCEPVKIEPIEEVFGQKLTMLDHKADAWRLQKLLLDGGIYLDTDVICNQLFGLLKENSVVLGEEKAYGKTVGLCSVVILAKPGANFMKRWWDGYNPVKSLWRGFRSSGHDLYWTELIIKYPYFLSHYWADEVKVVPFEQFYGFSWTNEDLKKFYKANEEIPQSYVYHLWSNGAYDRYLKDVSEESIKSSDTNFSRLILKYL
ncbi:hypothetical protein KKE78_04920 [Patescibacteria group bacterium]|nr:hypothetical protein [Patescibacteria group bacterium]